MLCHSLMVWTLTFGSSGFALYNDNSWEQSEQQRLEICNAPAASVLTVLFIFFPLFLRYLFIFKVNSCLGASESSISIAAIKTRVGSLFQSIIGRRWEISARVKLWPFGRFCPRQNE